MPATVQVLLTAAVIVSDWIASAVEHFPYLDERTSARRAEDAWWTLGLTPPWVPATPADIEAQFNSRFELPVGTQPRPVQRAVADAASTMAEPGLILVEAPMGEGKTEAALLAVEILAARFGAGGCFIALPTMATTDAMFSRVAAWIDRLPVGAVSTYLAHGKSALNPEFQEMSRLGRLAGVVQDDQIGDEDEKSVDGVAVALAWLSGRKKGVLSSFVVGTIDQVLMGGLKSRHLVLRHLALAGKVVVIDEVHASDEFMSVFLIKVLRWLGAYGVPTVLLSATLPAARRNEFVAAYRTRRVPETEQDGCPPAPEPLFRSRPRLSPRAVMRPAVAVHAGYPCVTTATLTGSVTTAVTSSGRELTVDVRFASDDDEALATLLAAALADGGCVAVVRNTVVRAQATAGMLRRTFGDVVVLVHSRFLGPDRMRKEAQLRRWLGPPGSGTERPARLIVVGTQVLEQSLDIDFDLMVSDLAPMDLLLQRIGRLHRHDRDPRDRGLMSQARCVIVGIEDVGVEPPVPVSGSVAVYGTSALLRSALTLRDRLADGVLELPTDVPALVEYASAIELAVPDTWSDVFLQAEEGADKRRAERAAQASQFSLGDVPANLVNWTRRGVGDAEGPMAQARVRDGDDSIEVLVVQESAGIKRVLPWIEPHGGRLLYEGAEPPFELARTVASCTLRLPSRLCMPWRLDRVVRELEARGVAAWQQSRWLKGQLVLVLDEQFETDLDGDRLKYDREDGLVVSKGDR